MFPPCRQYIGKKLAEYESGRPFSIHDFMWERSQIGEIRKIMRDKLEAGEVVPFLTLDGKPMPDMWRKA